MPSLNDARKSSTKQTGPENVEFGQKLSRRKSQDFASKILGWNEAGGGVLPKQNTAELVDKPKAAKDARKAKNKATVARHELEGKEEEEEEEERAEEEAAAAAAAAEDDRARNELEMLDDGVEVIVAADSTKTVDAVSETQLETTVEILPTTQSLPTEFDADLKLAGNSKKPGREVSLKRGAWVRRKSKPQLDLATDVKHAGAPKKRIVSDGHWRRDRLLKEDKETAAPSAIKEGDTTPKPIIIRRSVVSMGLKIPPSSSGVTEPNSEPVKVKTLRNVRPHSRSRSEHDRETSPDYETAGTKIYVKRRRRSRSFDNERNNNRDPRTSGSSLTASSSIDRPSSATDITPPSPLVTRKQTSTPLSEPRRTLKKTLSGEEDWPSGSTRQASHLPSATPRQPSTRQRPRTTEGTDKIPASTVPPKAFGNRIEGWLAKTPDPFLDGEDSSLAPKPLYISKSRSRASAEARSRSSHGIDNLRRDERRWASLRDDRDMHRLEERWSDSSPSATPTLQRRGARRSSRSPIKASRSQDYGEARAEPMVSGAISTPEDDLDPVSRPTDRTKARNASLKSAAAAKGRLQSGSPQQLALRSSSDLSENQTIIPEGNIVSRASSRDNSRRSGSGLKRRLTKHSDLMSVLSMSRDEPRAAGLAQGQRTKKLPAEPATLDELMNELSEDETKYQQELHTLVDGAIPILLKNALSGSETCQDPQHSANDPAVTKSIVDMGIPLERLRTTHKRIPLREPSDVLSWAAGAAKVYSDYIKAWRLGFSNVVVNLPPAQAAEQSSALLDREHALPGDQRSGSAMDKGQHVDIAYLLKRPLVRLKFLAKTFKGIDQFQSSPRANEMAVVYQNLVQEAKQRVNDENARLEDEAAASIDPTRARDPRSLAPITGVTIDPTRGVRARDCFDMELTHSSGQQLGCRIEIVYRDDAPERGKTGDILFCEISTTGRWLLFPPIPHSLVSARKSERASEIVVMVRGYLSNARQWREVLLLKADDSQTCTEWLQMLGSSPLPPRLSKRSSFNVLQSYASTDNNAVGLSPSSEKAPEKSREPSPREIEVPIGEQVKSSSRIWDGSEVNTASHHHPATGMQRSRATRHRGSHGSPYKDSQSDRESKPRYYYDKSQDDSHGGRRPVTAHVRSKSEWTASSGARSSKGYSVWLPLSDRGSDESSTEEDAPPLKRPSVRRRTASVPSLDLPKIPKLRKASQYDLDSRFTDFTSDASSDISQSTYGQQRESDFKASKRSTQTPHERQPAASNQRLVTPSKTASRPSAQARPASVGLRTGALPSFTPAFLKKHRRSSSPLKHEYEPSTASDSLSDSDVSALNDEDSITSESSADEAKADGVSTVGDLKAFQKYATRPYGQSQQTQSKQTPPPAQSFSLPSASLAPSESASQAPYRTVPPTDVEPAKTLACIFCWTDSGTWGSLHPEECLIFVTPGLIEAFDITQAKSVSLDGEGGECRTPTSKGIRPLVALELTPLVPLRRGTALDISVRSPPAANSLIRTGNNVMFRSRTPEECESLYALINRARIDNPTYIALQNARGPVPQSNWAEVMDRQNASRTTSSSWWHLGSRKSSTYRSKGSRTLSIAATESSIGTMNSAFSALRLFSSGSRMFGLGKSGLTSRESTRSTNSGSLSSGGATPSPPIDPRLGTPLGLTNAKIRLYVRESASKWRDLGPARLTVVLPPRQDILAAANPKTPAGAVEKRILVYGKSRGETLLDVTLGESAFERIARTGIAVSVWEETIGPNGETGRVGAVGGVLNTRARVYMVQMKSERDAAYTFGLVGKLRY